MAIYWIDPHLESPIGGIHGTTGSGLGTYSSPLSLVQARVWPAANYNSGDEFRIKGLPESVYFPTASRSLTGQSRSATTNSFGNEVVNRYVPAPADWDPDTNDRGILVRIKERDSNTRLYYTPYSYNSTGGIQTAGSTSTWQPALPQLDETYGFYMFDKQYSINSQTLYNAASSFYVFADQPPSVPITVTSGWISETQRGGVTILNIDYTYTSTVTFYFGARSTSESYVNFMTLDCPELVISASYSKYLHVQGKNINIKCLSGNGYMPGHAINIRNSGNFTAECLRTSGYLYLYQYNYDNTPATIDIDHISACYGNHIYFHWENDPNPAEYTLKLRSMTSYKAIDVQPNTTYAGQIINLELLDGWYLETDDPGDNGLKLVQPERFTFNVTQGVGGDIEYLAGNFINTFSSAVTISTNRSIKTADNTTITLDPNNVFLQGSESTARVYSTYIMGLNHTQTLETLNLSPFSFGTTTPVGEPMKINILRDSVSGRSLQVMAPTSTGPGITVFNSQAFGDKFVWHFSPQCIGKTYVDTFMLEDIDPTKQNILQYKYTLADAAGTGAATGLTVAFELNGINQNGDDVPVQSTIPDVSGAGNNVYELSYTIDPATITLYDLKTVFLTVTAVKTDNSISNIIFDRARLFKRAP